MKEFIAARKAGVPLIAVSTPDQFVSSKELAKSADAPAITWNIISGFAPLNPSGEPIAATLNGGEEPDMEALQPEEALSRMAKAPKNTVIFVFNGHMLLEQEGGGRISIFQGIANLRDRFKTSKRTLVLLGVSFRIPPELKNDILPLDVDLPGEEELAEMCRKLYKTAHQGKEELAESEATKCVDALIGLSAFSAENAFAMSLRKGGVDYASLWKRKVDIIEQTAGLKVLSTDMSFDMLKGQDALQGFMGKVISGKKGVRCFVFLDEIEKMMPEGGASDHTGVSQDQLAQLLKAMENYQWDGLIIVGFPGTGKTAFAQACGNASGAKVVEADLGAMKGSLVGQSEKMMRGFVETVRAMGDGKVFVIATSNDIKSLKPELKRRFTKGIYFSDLPDVETLDSIGKVYMAKYDIPVQEVPWDIGWTGAEIRNCCRNAWEFGVPLMEASQFVTIASRAMGRKVDELRREASGKYIDANKGGVFTLAEDSGEREVTV